MEHQLVLIFVMVSEIMCPDSAKFSHFGRILKVIGNFLRGFYTVLALMPMLEKTQHSVILLYPEITHSDWLKLIT